MANREKKILLWSTPLLPALRLSGLHTDSHTVIPQRLKCDLRNGINEWVTPIGPSVQVKRETDILRLFFLSGCWFTRRGEKVRLSILFLGPSNNNILPAHVCVCR